MVELRFPTGKIIKAAADLATHDAVEMANKLLADGFNGYIAVTARSKNGFEEGYAAFNEGNITAASYYNYKNNSSFRGKEALARVENALAGNGVFDIVELMPEQVNAAVELSGTEKFNTNALQKVEFMENFETEARQIETQPQQKDEKQELLKKYGLTSLSGE